MSGSTRGLRSGRRRLSFRGTGELGCATDMAVAGLFIMMVLHLGLAAGQQPTGVCQDTRSFSCFNGGTCEMIVQGENYTCHCPPEYWGDRCERNGEKCGNVYCLNGGVCITETNLCDCRSEWNGDDTCSTRVQQGNLGELQQTITVGSNGPRWYTVVFGVLGALILLGLCVATGVLLYRKHELEHALTFQEMKPGEVQMQPASGLTPLDNESLMPRGQVVSTPEGSSPHASSSRV